MERVNVVSKRLQMVKLECGHYRHLYGRGRLDVRVLCYPCGIRQAVVEIMPDATPKPTIPPTDPMF